MPESRPLADFSLDYPLIANRIEDLDAGTQERCAIILVMLEGAHALTAEQRSVSAQLMIEHAGSLLDELVDHVNLLAEELGCNHVSDRDRYTPAWRRPAGGEEGRLHVASPSDAEPPGALQ